MRKIVLLFSLVSIVVLNASSQLLYEPFNYTPHATLGLWTQSGGLWQTINTGDSILVESGNLSYPGLPASTGNKVKYDGAGTDYYRSFASQTTGTVYSSFILNVTSIVGLTTTGGYFTGFIQDANTTIFGATVWTRLSTTAGKYNIGIATRTTAAAVSWLPVDLDPGTSYFIVRAYEIITGTGNDVGKIWLNTTAIGGAEPTPDAVAAVGTDMASVARVFLRQENATNTPFIEVDEIRVGTTWASVTPGGAPVPTLSSTTLTSFGNTCINTESGPNSFTITGSNLTTADVTVAALPGFTFSTTSGGTYTSTLTLPQPGGAFSQQVFVKFNPTAVQSYNGNIVVSGGGATSINVAAAGSGINTMPSVTTGAASSITPNSATAAGTITATGCSAISAYGIEYSTSSGFPNGTGTQSASTNLAGGSFSSNLTALTPGTTYYYKAYATNAGGTAYGTEQSFTTTSITPVISTSPLTAFGNVCINTTAGPNSFTITGSNLTTANVTVAALPGFTYSTTAGGTYTTTLSLSQPGGAYSQQIFVKFDPVAVQSYSGNIVVDGGGISAPVNVAASGAGINSLPTVVTGSASSITLNSANAAGTISSNGCSSITAYGIEYSTTAGFPNGTGTQVASTNLAGGNFSSALAGLNPGTVYYFKAYATNAGGTAYGSEQNFTTLTLSPSLVATSLTAFGNVCINTTAGPNSFTITGSNLTTANVTVGPLAGYSFSTTSGGTYTASLNLTQPGGAFSQQVFVKFDPTAVQSYNGNIPVSGGGATTINVAAAGAGVNTAPTVTTGAASAITTTTATAAGSITATGCSAITAYGIEYSTTNNFPNGTGTQVASTNLAGGNFSSNLSGLTASTTYYYKAYATNAGGTTYGAQQSFTTTAPPPPVLSTNTLTAFGNICLNTTAGPNSFTITGNNLTNANVTVGPLAGYSFSTTSGGTYTASLSLAQPGGSFNQQVFVQFTPTAVQSYSGNIPVAGGGVSSAINVAASGAGVNTIPTVTTGAASSITASGATLAGSITANGCSAITSYGIEYSTTNGFVTGTPVVSSNLSGTSFTSVVSGLTAATTYYYKAFAINAGGKAYGAQQSFTTAPITLTTSTLTAFGNTCINTSATVRSFTISGTNLTTANVNVGPLTGYAYATSAGGPFTASLSLTQPGGTYNATIYVQFTPTAVQSYNGNIPVSGGGAAAINVAASGAGVNTVPVVTTNPATHVSTHSAVFPGTVNNSGCSNVTSYGFEYSSIRNFPAGTGTQVNADDVVGNNFFANVENLVQGAKYYYRAYAVNSGGTGYGLIDSVTIHSIPEGFTVFPVPAKRGSLLNFSMNNLKPGNYQLMFINSEGRLVHQENIHIQANFINQSLNVKATLPPGMYRLILVNTEDVIANRTILIMD